MNEKAISYKFKNIVLTSFEVWRLWNTWKQLNNWRIETWNFVLTSVVKIENFALISVEILLTGTIET